MRVFVIAITKKCWDRAVFHKSFSDYDDAKNEVSRMAEIMNDAKFYISSVENMAGMNAEEFAFRTVVYADEIIFGINYYRKEN